MFYNTKYTLEFFYLLMFIGIQILLNILNIQSNINDLDDDLCVDVK